MTLDPKWTATVDDGLTNSKWDQHDDEIRREVTEYNKRFSSTPGYSNVDWLKIKAIVWVESGGPKSAAWLTRPMQIGNPGDPAYNVVKHGKEGSTLIMSGQLVKDLSKLSINTASLNIRAGIAYLFTRMAKFETKSVDDTKDTKTHDYKVQTGDSFDKISRKVGTTIEVLQKLNPTAKVLHKDQIIKYNKAKMRPVITGWRAFSTTEIANRYNVGDPSYAEKLDYVLELFKKLKR